jgi:hypothetical protein
VIEIARVETASLHIASFRRNFHFNADDNQNYFDQVCKDAQKNRTKIHVLKVDGLLIGFIALSIQCMTQKFNTQKYLNIDYIFVDDQHRQKFIKNYGKKASEVLIDIAIKMALDIQEIVPLVFIAAEPAHDKLLPLYRNSGFNQLAGEQNTFFFSLKSSF